MCTLHIAFYNTYLFHIYNICNKLKIYHRYPNSFIILIEMFFLISFSIVLNIDKPFLLLKFTSIYLAKCNRFKQGHIYELHCNPSLTSTNKLATQNSYQQS